MNRFEELKAVELGEKIGYKKGFEAARKQFERPHGEWNVRHDTMYHFECPFCKYLHQYKDNFCPLCGADMREGETE